VLQTAKKGIALRVDAEDELSGAGSWCADQRVSDGRTLLTCGVCCWSVLGTKERVQVAWWELTDERLV